MRTIRIDLKTDNTRLDFRDTMHCDIRHECPNVAEPLEVVIKVSPEFLLDILNSWFENLQS